MSWTMIEHQALTGNAATVTLGNGGTIPQTYKSLRLVMSVRCSDGSNVRSVIIRVNNNTSNYNDRYLTGNGSAASASSGAFSTAAFVGDVPGTSMTTSTFASIEVNMSNYTTSDYKRLSVQSVAENNGTLGYQRIIDTNWANSAAVTSLVILPDIGSFVQYSTFTLYGLK